MTMSYRYQPLDLGNCWVKSTTGGGRSESGSASGTASLSVENLLIRTVIGKRAVTFVRMVNA